MNKVTSVNLSGNAYQLEESGYETLHDYLDGAARRLENNPDKDEILADIEQALAEKFRALLGPHKSVVLAREVDAILAEMGPVEDDAMSTDDAPGSQPGAAQAPGPEAAKGSKSGKGTDNAGQSGGPARRLYRISEGAMFAGVCAGIAAYFGIDVIVVRMSAAIIGAFCLLFSLTASWFALLPLVAYGLLVILIPAAGTPDEKAAARGEPSTAQEFIRRARQGYYEGMKSFQDHAARKEWKRKFKQEMRGWRNSFRREMHDHAHHWREHGRRDWTRNPSAAIGAMIALPIVSLVLGVLGIVWLVAVVLLVIKGAVFGVALPAGVPVWVGFIALVFFFQVLSWPLKAMRRASYIHATGEWRHAPCVAGFWDSIVWLAAFAAAVWLADHYVPAVHTFIVHLPGLADQIVTAVKQWWATL